MSTTTNNNSNTMEGIIEGSTTATGTQGTTNNGSGSGSGGRVKDPVHEANLERTIRELKRMTADAEATLNEVSPHVNKSLFHSLGHSPNH